VQAYVDGELVNCLADRFTVHRDTVLKIVERHGAPRRYRSLTPNDVANAAALHAAGDSLSTVGQRLGVEASTILRAFRLAGIKTRPQQGGRHRNTTEL
jgi:hypothetical protein